MPSNVIRLLLVEDDPYRSKHLIEALPKGSSGSSTLRVERSESAAAPALLTAGDFDGVLWVVEARRAASDDCFSPDELEDAARFCRRYPRLPVVLILSARREGLAQRVLEVGAEGYMLRDELQGPCLERVIEGAIARKRWQSEHDVSAKGLHAELDSYERRLHIFTEHGAVGISLLDAAGGILYENNVCLRLLGAKPGNRVGSDFFLWVHPEEVQRCRDCFYGTEEQSERLQFRYHHASGRWIWLEASVRNHLNDPDVKGLVVNFHDITAQKEFEQARERDRQLYHTLAANFPNGNIYLLDRDSRILLVDGRGLESIGLDAASLIGKRLDEVFGGTEAESVVRDAFQNALRGEEVNAETPFRGTWRSIRAVPVRNEAGVVTAVVAITQDVTVQKRAAEVLRASEEHLRQIADSSNEVFWLTDPQTSRILYISPSYERIWGRTCQNLYENPLSFVEAVHPEDRDRLIKALTEKAARGGFDEEYRVVQPDGSIRWIWDRARPVLDEQGHVYRVAGIAQDITERRLAEEKLRHSEQFNRDVLDAVLANIAVLDQDGVITAVNHGWTRFAQENLFNQIPQNNGVGASYLEECRRVTGELAEEAMAMHDGILGVLRGERENFSLEYACHSPEVKRWFIANVTRLHTENGGAVVSHHDITERRQAEEALRESETLLRLVTNTVRIGLVLVSREHRYLYANSSYGEVLGLPQGDITGRFVADVLPAVYEEQIRPRLTRAFQGERVEYELKVPQRDGAGERVFAITYEPRLEAIEPCVLVVVVEITEHKQAAAQVSQGRNRLSGILDSAMDAIISIDEAQRIQIFNPAAERMFGCARDEVLGQSIELLIPQRFRAGHRQHIETFARTGLTSRKMGALGAIHGLRANGEEFPIEASISQIQIDNEKLFTVILRDITDRIDDQAKLKRAHDELEERVAKRTAELAQSNQTLQVEIAERQMAMNALREAVAQVENAREEAEAAQKDAEKAQQAAEAAQQEAEAARAEAERANHAKSDFLSRMSHELRTPMNSILGFAQIMEMDAHTEEDVERVGYILKSGQHLLKLINEVLDLARVESGNLMLSPEAVNVTNAVQMAVEVIRPLCQQRDLHLIVDYRQSADYYVHADQQRLSQVLINLLSNAVKYNRVGGEVRVECEPVAGDRLSISISDTGNGIAPQNFDRLFNPFDRLGAESTGIEGTGLGLSLTRYLVEAMGGTMRVSSTIGQGSTFAFDLALTANPVDEYDSETENSSSPHAFNVEHTVLYIEDNLANVQVVQHILEKQSNVKLITAMQGGIGLELAREHKPALILLDLHLPDMQGDEVMKRLLADPATCDTPIVIISADATPKQIRRLLTSGATEYITKPIDVRQFLEVLNRLLD